MEFVQGTKFSSYDVFSTRLKLYEQTTHSQFSLVGAEKLSESDPLFQRFRYRVLRYHCKQGPRTKERSSKNERPLQRSYKVGCPVQLNVRLNQPKGTEPFLKVTKLTTEHSGHEVSEEVFNLYPEQRRIIMDEVDQTILASRTMKPSEQREILENRHAGCVMRQDVYNLQRRLGVGNGGDDSAKCQNIIGDLVSSGGVGEVGKNESGEFLFVCFMTSSMKKLLMMYPECLVLDCTYKVNNYLYPLMTVMVIDSEGHGMPVFHAFLAKEDRHILESCLRIFARQFDTGNAQCFIVDKDMAEIAAIGSVFPDVPINLCQFHISQAVERFLRKELGRGTSGSKVVLDSFMTQVTSESEDEFEELVRKISDIVPQSVRDYFMENWWSKRHLWAACCNTNVIKLNATTTNTLESYHGKIKKVINEKQSLSTALSSQISFDNSKISERERLFIIASNSDVYDHRDQDNVSKTITSCLSGFGAELVKHELFLSRKVVYSVVEGLDCYTVSYRDKEYSTSVTTCSCSTYGHFKIPCRHIFFLRCHLNFDLFDVVLVPERFRRTQAVSESFPSGTSDFQISTFSSAPVSLHTVDGRFNTAKVLCDKAARFLSILGVSEFQQKFKELEEFLDRWLCEPSSSVSVSSSFPSQSDFQPCSDSVGPDNFVPECIEPVIESESVSDHVVDIVPLSGAHITPNDLLVVPCPATPDPNSFHSVPAVDVDPVTPLILNPSGNASVPVSSSSLVPSDAQLSCDTHGFVNLSHVPDSACSVDPLSVSESVCPVPQDISDSSGVTSSWPKMSRLVKPRGRPCNRQRFTLKRRRQIPKTFTSLSDDEKINLLLPSVTIHSHVPDKLIPVEEIKPLADFHDNVLDERVDMLVLKNLFEPTAWVHLKDCLEDRVAGQIFSCGDCHAYDDGKLKMIQCEQCLAWYHFECVGYSSRKQVALWFCESCL